MKWTKTRRNFSLGFKCKLLFILYAKFYLQSTLVMNWTIHPPGQRSLPHDSSFGKWQIFISQIQPSILLITYFEFILQVKDFKFILFRLQWALATIESGKKQWWWQRRNQGWTWSGGMQMPNTNSGKLQKLCIQASKILGTRNLPSLVSNFFLLPHAVFGRAAIWICFIVAAFLHGSNSFADFFPLCPSLSWMPLSHR